MQMNRPTGRFSLLLVVTCGVLVSLHVPAHAVPRVTVRRLKPIRQNRTSTQRARTQAQRRAQQTQTQEQMQVDEARWQERSLAQIEQQVELTPAQKTQVEPMLVEMSHQIASVSAQNNISAGAKQKNIQGLYSTTWKRIQGLLTPQQQATLQQNQRLDDLTQELTLSDSQRTRVQLALQDELAQTEALTSAQTQGTDAPLSDEEKADKQQSIEDDIWGRIEAALTLEQQQKLDALRVSQIMAALDKQLTLTSPEKTQITPLVTKAAPKLRAARADSTLSPVKRDAQLHQLRDELHASIRPLLTDKQQALFDAPPAKPTGTAAKSGT